MTVKCGKYAQGSRRKGSGTNPAAAMFSVPSEVRYLNGEQMEALTRSVRQWRNEAVKANVRRSRDRIWLIFLLMRHTGGRLGEILALDPARDIDQENRVVRLGAAGENGDPDKAREVPVPEDVMREIALYVNDPCNTGHGGPAFAMDLGYVRRKLYERAEAASLPRSLAGPNVIRNSRAVEMLRAGTPLAVVQNVLGLEGIGQAARFLEFSDQDLKRMKRFYARKEMSNKTSARNTFMGVVTHVRSGAVMSEVELATPCGHRLAALITSESLHTLGIVPDGMVLTQIKAPFVHLAPAGAAPSSSLPLNTFQGSITDIKEDVAITEVVVTLGPDEEICALLSSREARDMALEKGRTVLASFKSLSVVLQVE